MERKKIKRSTSPTKRARIERLGFRPFDVPEKDEMEPHERSGSVHDHVQDTIVESDNDSIWPILIIAPKHDPLSFKYSPVVMGGFEPDSIPGRNTPPREPTNSSDDDSDAELPRLHTHPSQSL